MSERQLRLFLSELNRLRICCTGKECGGVIEVGLDQLTDFADHKKLMDRCPVCGETFDFHVGTATGAENYLRQLSSVIHKLKQTTKQKIEFVLPEPAKPEPDKVNVVL